MLAPGTLILDCGTGDPDQVVALAVRLAARGVRLVDGPLSGSSQQIREGTAVMMMGGDREACDALEPVLAAIAPRHFLLGPPGSGARAKLATNLLLGLNRAALAESLVFARGARASTCPPFLDLVRATPAYSRAVDAKGQRMIDGEFAPPQSRITQHRKDLALMLEAAKRAGHALPLTTMHAELLDAAIADGAGDLDNAAIIDTIRHWRKPACADHDPGERREGNPRRHHHEWRHGKDGHQPASHPLDQGHPRPGRRRARRGHADHARPDSRRPQ